MVDEAGAGAVELERSEVQSLLSRRLQGQPTRANFRTGDLTICTLVPMRSVPHRVIGLLGLTMGCSPVTPSGTVTISSFKLPASVIAAA